MFSDPMTITINSVPFDLNKTSVSGEKSEYNSADGKMTLVISHARSGNRVGRLFGFSQRVIAADPITGTNREQELKVNVTINEPWQGDWAFNDTYASYVIEAVKALLSTANQTKLLAGQS